MVKQHGQWGMTNNWETLDTLVMGLKGFVAENKGSKMIVVQCWEEIFLDSANESIAINII